MTYKRFTYIPFDGFEDNGEFITPYQVVKLLNELHKENDALKQVLKTKVVVNRQYEELQILKKENEQLKKSIECQNEMIKEQCMKIDWASECGVKWDKEFKEWSGIR